GSIDALAAASEEELQTAEEVGPNTAAAIAGWFSHPRHKELIDNLRSRGVNFQSHAPRQPRPGALSGKTVVLTGTLPGITRDEATLRLEAAGAKVSGSLSRKTDFLLAGENAGSKLEKAGGLGVRAVTWEEMLQIIRSRETGDDRR